MKRKIKGSLTVEAAITVPVIIIIMLPFLYILRSLYVYDCVRTAVMESAQMLENVLYLTNYIGDSDKDGANAEGEAVSDEVQGQVEQYDRMLESINEYTGGEGIEGLVQNVVLQQIVRLMVYDLTEEQHLESWGLENGALGISYVRSRFFYEDDNRDALFCISAQYEFEFPFVSSFAKMEPVEIQCIGRAYVGKPAQVSDIEDTEKISEKSEVRYRIGNGDHYHTADCYLIAKDIVNISVDEAENRGYIKCRSCKPAGSTVTVTLKGEKYHTEDCRYIAPNLTIVNENEIEEHGYLPCDICIGGGQWFQ